MFLPLNWRDMGLMDELLDGLETGWMTTSTGTTNSSMSGNQKCAASLKGPYLKQCCSVSLSMGLSAPSAFCGLRKLSYAFDTKNAKQRKLHEVHIRQFKSVKVTVAYLQSGPI